MNWLPIKEVAQKTHRHPKTIQRWKRLGLLLLKHVAGDRALFIAVDDDGHPVAPKDVTNEPDRKTTSAPTRKRRKTSRKSKPAGRNGGSRGSRGHFAPTSRNLIGNQPENPPALPAGTRNRSAA